MKALQVIENFLHYEKGQIIKSARHIEAILKSPFAHNVNQITLPDAAHKGAEEPAVHPALSPVASAPAADAAK